MSPVRPFIVTAVALVLVVVSGCGKGKKSGSAARTAVLEAWKEGGLEPSAMTAATVPFGKDCQSGTVGGVDVLVCAYSTSDEAKAAEEAGLEWVGSTTGMAQARGAVLIAAADRRKSDLSGRTINQLGKLAPK